jgi:hypothetical protein
MMPYITPDNNFHLQNDFLLLSLQRDHKYPALRVLCVVSILRLGEAANPGARALRTNLDVI